MFDSAIRLTRTRAVPSLIAGSLHILALMSLVSPSCSRLSSFFRIGSTHFPEPIPTRLTLCEMGSDARMRSRGAV